MIDFTLIWESLPSLYQGALVSLQITLVAALIGMGVGSILGLAEISSLKIIRFCVEILSNVVDEHSLNCLKFLKLLGLFH